MQCEGHSHDHDHDDELGLSLQAHIDMSQVYCLNEHVPNAGRAVLKPYVDRLTLDPNLQSQRDDDDLELLMHIPFSEAVSIRHICISGRASIYLPNGNEDEATSAPCTVKVFANRNDICFETARDLDADATVQLMPPEHTAEIQANYQNSMNEERQDGSFGASVDYPLRPGHKFRSCTSVTLFFGDNFAQRVAEAEGRDDDDVIPTEINYIGFKGIGTSFKRQAVQCVYETRGMKKDHKMPGAEFGARESQGF